MSQNLLAESRPAGAESFSRRVRISARRDFTATYESGRRYQGRLAVVFARPLGEAGRLGITATRKVGNAVHRNRARRRIREIYRRWRAVQPLSIGLDVVVNATAACASAPYAVLATELAALLDRAATAERAEKA